MKLAEALSERKELLKQIADLDARIRVAAIRYEDEDKEEDALGLVTYRSEKEAELENLIVEINLANINNKLPGKDFSIMVGIARRDVLMGRVAFLKTLVEEIRNRNKNEDRWSKRDKDSLKKLAQIPLETAQEMLNRDSKDLRELVAAIQAANWTIELK